jgi:hypothetical protein
VAAAILRIGAAVAPGFDRKPEGEAAAQEAEAAPTRAARHIAAP